MEQVNRKCQVVLLDVNKINKHHNIWLNSNNLLINTTTSKPENLTAKYLYILSSEEIKEGDWVLDNNILCKALECFPSTVWCKKVISTTNPNLLSPICEKHKSMVTNVDERCTCKGFGNYLAKINQDFINKYISEYNKGNIIKEVMVEYERCVEPHLVTMSSKEYFIPKKR